MSLSVPVADLLRWNDETARRWRDLVRAHPEILSLPCDVRGGQNAGQLLQHIVAVELRYAERLAGTPETAYESVLYGTADEIFATHMRALDMIHALLADEGFDWNHDIEFTTLTLGKLRASRRDILLHLLFHGIRHYAQLATLVRAAGISPGWPMDFLLVNAKRVPEPPA